MTALARVPEKAVRWYDDRQQARLWLAFPTAVIRKYADDRGTALAGLVTYHVFLGMLPLLVVLLTVLGRVVEGSDHLRDAALGSTLGQLPVVGPRLRNDVSALSATGPVLAISILAMLWTASGIYHSVQLAVNQVWNVEGVERQGFVSRHLRALALFTLVVTAAIGTAPLRRWAIPWSLPPVIAVAIGTAAGAVLAAVVLLGVLRLAVSPAVPLVRLVPAAGVAGLLWELLQQVGGDLVLERLSRADDLYGALGVVVVTLLWINILARSTILANECAVVGCRRLWPRRIAQPPLTEADRRVLQGLMGNERRRPEQHAEVTFDEGADHAGDDE